MVVAQCGLRGDGTGLSQGTQHPCCKGTGNDILKLEEKRPETKKPNINCVSLRTRDQELGILSFRFSRLSAPPTFSTTSSLLI